MNIFSVKCRRAVCIAAVLSAAALTASGRRGEMPWGVGEKLTFAVRWGIITGGYAHMEVRESLSLGGRDTFRIVSQARSSALFDPFYKVRDVIESYIDAEHMHTVRFEEDISEGSYSRQSVIIYDHDSGFAYQNGVRFEVTPNVQDILSSLYYLRTKELKVGDRYEFDVGTGKKNWPLVVDVTGRETVRVPAGRFRTLIVEPQIREEEGIFRKADGTLRVWLTDDSRKMPVLMKSRIPIGHISAVLIESELP